MGAPGCCVAIPPRRSPRSTGNVGIIENQGRIAIHADTRLAPVVAADQYAHPVNDHAFSMVIFDGEEPLVNINALGLEIPGRMRRTKPWRPQSLKAPKAAKQTVLREFTVNGAPS